MLADKKVDMVIAGGFGEKMIGALAERGIRHLEITGKVKEALLQIGRE